MSAPRSLSICAVCVSVVPAAASAWRPSVISRNIVFPPSLKPIAVRGATLVSPWPRIVPLVISGLLVPIAHCICCAAASLRP